MKTTGDIYKDIKEARFNYRVGRMKEELIKLNDKKWFSEEEIIKVIDDTIMYINNKIPKEEKKIIFEKQISVLNFIKKELFGETK